MRVSDLPFSDKPREKLFRHGPSGLSLSELIAVILGTGVQKKDVMEVAESIVREYGGDLSKLCVSSAREFCTITGIGPAKGAALSASLELGRRIAQGPQNLRQDYVTLEEAVEEWSEGLRYEAREFFIAIYLDGNRRVIDSEKISYGGAEGAFIDSGYLLKRAVRLGARGAAVLHNHPDNTLESSREDEMVTDFLSRQFKILDIQFFGHFIVSSGKYKKCHSERDC